MIRLCRLHDRRVSLLSEILMMQLPESSREAIIGVLLENINDCLHDKECDNDYWILRKEGVGQNDGREKP